MAINMKIKLTKPDGVIVSKERAYCGSRSVPLIVMKPKRAVENAPGVLWIHGGGYVFGMKEMVYMSRAVDLATKCGAVVVSPGYRLAFQKPYPAALNDCFAALEWLKGNCAGLGVSPEKLVVGGESAGGGLAAAVCMRARDEGKIKIACQLPLYPMISNLDTKSSENNHGKIWNTNRNHIGWRMYLRRDAKKQVSPYASPSMQTYYSNLPACYTFVGDGEPFYDETMSYIACLKAAGVEASADVYHTDVHAFDMLYPEKEISKEAARNFLDYFTGVFDN